MPQMRAVPVRPGVPLRGGVPGFSEHEQARSKRNSAAEIAVRIERVNHVRAVRGKRAA